MGSGFGGLAMRSLNNILAPVYVSGIHKIVKPLMNLLHAKILYRSNNKWIINFKAGLLCIKEIFELLSITYINER